MQLSIVLPQNGDGKIRCVFWGHSERPPQCPSQIYHRPGTLTEPHMGLSLNGIWLVSDIGFGFPPHLPLKTIQKKCTESEKRTTPTCRVGLFTFTAGSCCRFAGPFTLDTCCNSLVSNEFATLDVQNRDMQLQPYPLLPAAPPCFTSSPFSDRVRARLLPDPNYLLGKQLLCERSMKPQEQPLPCPRLYADRLRFAKWLL